MGMFERCSFTNFCYSKELPFYNRNRCKLTQQKKACSSWQLPPLFSSLLALFSTAFHSSSQLLPRAIFIAKTLDFCQVQSTRYLSYKQFVLFKTQPYFCLFGCNRGDTTRPALSSHEHRTLVCLFLIWKPTLCSLISKSHYCLLRVLCAAGCIQKLKLLFL